MLKAFFSLLPRWCVRQPAYMLLRASDELLASEPPGRFNRAWVGLMTGSLGWGILSMGVWATAWRVFGDYFGLPLMPAVAVVAVTTLWLYRLSFLALGEIIGDGPTGGRALGCSIIVAVFLFAMLGLKGWNPDWSTPTWQWIRPRALYRPLILAPVWGAWSMIIVPQFRRPGKNTEPAVSAFSAGCGPLTAAACLVAPLAGSIVYFNYLQWTQLGISVATVIAAIGGGLIFCRLVGGLNRKALLATNLLTQLVFFLAFLANR